METLEVTPVESQDGATRSSGIRQDAGIIAATFPSLLYGQHIMPQQAQVFDNAVIKILVRIQERHAA
jgi:hypothetical protein